MISFQICNYDVIEYKSLAEILLALIHSYREQ